MNTSLHVLGGPDGRTPVPAKDHRELAEFFSVFSKRQVAVEKFELDGEEVCVSTVFLGTDYGFGLKGVHEWFETMVFPSQNVERCETWEQAEKQHARIVAAVKAKEIQAYE